MSDEPTHDELLELLAIPGVSGDEGAVADWVEARARDAGGVRLVRVGDNVIALKGKPRRAVFAHLDTVGFTLGYKDALLRVGGPQPEDRDPVRCADGLIGRLRVRDGKEGERRWELRGVKGEPTPGSRWVYARAPKIENGFITSPYLDNRAGVWSALRVLRRAENVAVAFTTGEEQHGHGARVCADLLYREHAVAEAFIADITWHTEDTPCGKGVVISLRDAHCPRQRFLDWVLARAAESGVPHQREIQSAGSSDGGHVLHSATPLDWVFVGAPEMVPHTSREQASLADLDAMTDLLTYLVGAG
jgi:putative aminopeptidase FrvX